MSYRDMLRPSAELVAQAAAFPAATLHEAAGQIGVLTPAIKPVHPKFRVCGPALTVISPPGDNLWLHRAIYQARPGDVLVVDTGGEYEFGYWGEIMSHAALQQGVGGVVLDACVRDGELLPKIGLPIFARGLCIRGTGKNKEAYGAINHPIRINGLAIHPGDLVVGDLDGVVVIPRDRIADTLARAKGRLEQEEESVKRLMAGDSTLNILGLN